jgi:hypothetical protein
MSEKAIRRLSSLTSRSYTRAHAGALLLGLTLQDADHATEALPSRLIKASSTSKPDAALVYWARAVPAAVGR